MADYADLFLRQKRDLRNTYNPEKIKREKEQKETAATEKIFKNLALPTGIQIPSDVPKKAYETSIAQRYTTPTKPTTEEIPTTVPTAVQTEQAPSSNQITQTTSPLGLKRLTSGKSYIEEASPTAQPMTLPEAGNARYFFEPGIGTTAEDYADKLSMQRQQGQPQIFDMGGGTFGDIIGNNLALGTFAANQLPNIIQQRSKRLAEQTALGKQLGEAKLQDIMGNVLERGERLPLEKQLLQLQLSGKQYEESTRGERAKQERQSELEKRQFEIDQGNRKIIGDVYGQMLAIPGIKTEDALSMSQQLLNMLNTNQQQTGTTTQQTGKYKNKAKIDIGNGQTMDVLVGYDDKIYDENNNEIDLTKLTK